ncbi:penicillin-binding protein [Novosphingobium sp. FSY-8]|uniref:peptidoglycan glycosyltransferase n=2 Tax=Novosphingobium ovatum TaxID=1908523 RepID=A0ABW9XC48_9SPHN|nr:transglycosylase domain-containing protein [Novosphingobium ovatum]NBC36088.1 penicillin-binding protein [Novosphingobium ovatum]
MLAVLLIGYVAVIRNLPDADRLLTYQPRMPTMVRGGDGAIVYSYARERRVQLRYVDFPKPLINAFISAEDKNFFSHGGVDYIGLAQAVVDYALKYGSDERARGGSTITQQVAKNILIGNEYSVSRKLREMIVARRIESVLTKQQILELYLNEIPLGRQSFGVQAAARAYFNKDVGDLQLHEAAFLAILPKAPEVYGRARAAEKAMARRNWVLDQMVRNGHVDAATAAAAKAQPLGIVPHHAESYDPAVGYFVEEVRRQLIDQYGENAEAGPNSVYDGGLWVRTSLDLTLQNAAQDALRSGLLRYAAGKGWHKPIAHVDIAEEGWRGQLAMLNKSVNYANWRVGLILKKAGSNGQIGFVDGSMASLVGIPDGARRGDVVAAAPAGPGAYALRIVPEVSGGMLVEQPGSGRVLAMAGGFDAGLDAFNRATQAQRQPGSTIKPFVYATGLDNGMTPASMVADQPFCVFQGGNLGQKCFRNFDNRGMGGIHTMRWGLEQSRNLMTVHIANDVGMDKVVKTISRVGIGDYQPYFSFALGAGETTVARMVSAYATLANAGMQRAQTLIDYIQDRNGKVIWRADNRKCPACNMVDWDGKPMPRLGGTGRQVLDARTAYQTVHMLEGVVQRGTAVTLRDLGLPLFGKTGTTSGPTNVWFVGGSPNIVGGVYIGYDQPRSLGGWVQGGTFAAPIFKQFVMASRARWDHTPFVAPAGVSMVKVNRVSGQRVFGGSPGDDPKADVIWEAFKPETQPTRETRSDQLAARRSELLDAIRRGFTAMGGRGGAPRQPEAGQEDFVVEQGGVY